MRGGGEREREKKWEREREDCIGRMRVPPQYINVFPRNIL